MGFGTFLKSLVNAEAMGDQIISVQMNKYREAQGMSPNAEPHMHLVQVWLSRMAVHGMNPMDGTVQAAAFAETAQFSCLAFPSNVRALGLYFIYKERPDIIRNYPRFKEEFERIMAPVVAATENGEMDLLYSQFNPKMAAQHQ